MVDDESTSILLPYFSFQLKNVDVEGNNTINGIYNIRYNIYRMSGI